MLRIINISIMKKACKVGLGQTGCAEQSALKVNLKTMDDCA